MCMYVYIYIYIYMYTHIKLLDYGNVVSGSSSINQRFISDLLA